MSSKEDTQVVLKSRIEIIEEELRTKSDLFEKATVKSIMDFVDKIYIFHDRVEIVIDLWALLGVDDCDLEEKKTITISKSLRQYKLGYNEQSMNETKERVYQAIVKNTKAHIDEIVQETGLTKSMVETRIRTLKSEGRIKSQGAREKFSWIILKPTV